MVTIFITLGLTFAVWLTQSLRLIDFIVNRGLPASTFFTFVALLLPSFLGLVLPIATFCAVLFIYNKLTVDSELVVMRAAGMSPLQLARPAILVASVSTVAVYVITLYLQPLSYQSFKDLQSELRDDYSTVLLQEGVFNSLGDRFTVYVRERSGDGELRGILVHDHRDPEKPVTMMAERGALISAEDGPRVVMVNGNRQEIERATGRFSLLNFDRYTVEISELEDRPETRWRKPKERYLSDLFNPGSSVNDERYRDELIAEGHQRLVAPLYSLTFAFVGLAALLSGQFNRRGQLRRLLAAIFCVAALEGLSLGLHDLASDNLNAVPLMYLAVLAPIGASLYIMIHRPRSARSTDAVAEGATP